jgi:hypothetical protein
MAIGFPVKADYATGDVLTAANMNDFAGTVNLAVSATPTTATQMAGKNKIINGDFGIWQRGTSFANVAAGAFSADRWRNGTSDGSGTVAATQEVFTPGTAPVTGYESSFFHRSSITALGTANNYTLVNRIEDVRSFANQTIAISFFAKADSARTLQMTLQQNFGSGGSATVTTTAGSATLTTSWARYSFTLAVPSVSGKTIGASSFFGARFLIDGASFSATTVLDLWGVQVEAGSIATPFQTATGTIQGELAAAQRYFWRANAASTHPKAVTPAGSYYSTTAFYTGIPLPSEMRTAPSFTAGTVASFSVYSNGTGSACTAIALGTATPNMALLNCTTAAKTAGHAGWLETAASTNAYLDFSAEL